MVYMYHSFLVHSSADGHLGCFHVLAMKNSAAMNIGVHVSLSDFKYFGLIVKYVNFAPITLDRYSCMVPPNHKGAWNVLPLSPGWRGEW